LGGTVHQGISLGCELLGGFPGRLGTAETPEGGCNSVLLEKSEAWESAVETAFCEWGFHGNGRGK